ncbi:MAG: AmmeMemoRadiSam system protein B [Magnetococcus sp. WYHC-3]
MSSITLRMPAVAGLFYPEDPLALREQVRGFIQSAPPAPREPVALVAPHAGYVYSGATAGHAYRSLHPADAQRPRRVFLLGPSHRVYLEGASVGNYHGFSTPLGVVPVDTAVTTELARQPGFTDDPAAHRQEHSLEVQLPFLQESLGAFSLVPICFGRVDPLELGRTLSPYLSPGDLLVVSSDLSHYHPYEHAMELDGRCHQAVLALDDAAMGSVEACGNLGMRMVMDRARRRGWIPVLADYRNSAEISGDRSRVVGYASYLFFDASVTPPPPWQRALPGKVREHLTRVLAGQSGGDSDALMALSPELARLGACFITLTRDGQLRGCIGSLVAHRSLAEDLLRNAETAALQDPRFPPVTAAELSALAVEVSLLTPPQPLPHRDARELLELLRPGEHGVILARDGRRATFLPQVWDQLPHKVDFLRHLCRKAGMPMDAWEDGAEVQTYTVVKLREGD